MKVVRFEILFAAMVMLGVGFLPAARAIDFVWDGGGDEVSWDDPLNWTADVGFPGIADTAMFDSGNTVNLTSAIPNGFVSATVMSGELNLPNLSNVIPSGTFIVQSNATLTVASGLGASGLGDAEVVLDGGTIAFAPGSVTVIPGFAGAVV